MTQLLERGAVIIPTLMIWTLREARRTTILQHTERKPQSQIDKMKRQRAMYQMKEQDKTPEKQLNEVEIGNLPEKEFRIMTVKMIQDLGKRMEAKDPE